MTLIIKGFLLVCFLWAHIKVFLLVCFLWVHIKGFLLVFFLWVHIKGFLLVSFLCSLYKRVSSSSIFVVPYKRVSSSFLFVVYVIKGFPLVSFFFCVPQQYKHFISFPSYQKNQATQKHPFLFMCIKLYTSLHIDCKYQCMLLFIYLSESISKLHYDRQHIYNTTKR